MSLELLRECIRKILREAVRTVDSDGVEVYEITEDDVESFMGWQNTYADSKNKVYVSNSMRSDFLPNAELGASSMKSLGSKYKFATEHAMEVMKKGKLVNGMYVLDLYKPEFLDQRGNPKKNISAKLTKAQQLRVRLAMSKKLRDRIINEMASGIVQTFASKKIDVVMWVDSTYDFSEDLGKEVSKQMALPLVHFKKNMDADKADYEHEKFAEWETDPNTYKQWQKKNKENPEKFPSFKDYTDNVYQGLNATDLPHIQRKIRAGVKPSLKRNIHKDRAKFWNLFDKPEKAGDKKRVLVVDDNYAQGLTTKQVEERLLDAGYIPFFAAGYAR